MWWEQLYTADAIRLLVVGDTHSKGDDIWRVVDTARRVDADAIIQLGDFGYGFSGFEAETMFSCRYSAQWSYEARDIPVAFIDGNHEHHDALDFIRQNGYDPVRIVGDVTYMPRGCTLEWAGHEVVFFGGTNSVDRHNHRQGIDWFPQESITQQEVNEFQVRHITSRSMATPSRTSVLFTHDATNHSLMEEIVERVGHHWPDYLVREAWNQRELISHVQSVCKPELHIHGHWHMPYAYPDRYGLIVGLDKVDNETINHATMVLDLERGNPPIRRATVDCLSTRSTDA